MFPTSCSPLFYLHCYSQVTSISYVHFRSLFLTDFFQMPSLNRNEKMNWEKCGTQTTKNSLARHKNRCSVGTLYCTQGPNFSTKSQNDLKYHIAKKHGVPQPDITFRCKLCYQEFPRFYALPQHKYTQRGTQIGFGAGDADVENIVGDVDDQSFERRIGILQTFSDRYRNGEWRT